MSAAGERLMASIRQLQDKYEVAQCCPESGHCWGCALPIPPSVSEFFCTSCVSELWASGAISEAADT